jgi:hypothetical protein
MASEATRRFWRRCRVTFRWCRISVQLAILALLVAAIYLNQTGLPDFIKRPLLAELRGRGVNLEFSRLRWRWLRGIVAEEVRFGATRDVAIPRLSAKEVELEINHSQLLHRRWQVDALDLRGGRLEWFIPPTNAPTTSLTVSNIEARLRLPPGDEWVLDDFHARFAGAQFTVTGSVTNATAIRDWAVLRGEPSAHVNWPERLRRLANTLERISFSQPPELQLRFAGDALQPQSFNARFHLRAADADTPWGCATNVTFAARLFAAGSNELSHAELTLQAASARTPWADGTNLELQLRLLSLVPEPELVEADLAVRADGVGTKWAAVTNAEFTAHWVHALTNAVPLSGRGELRAVSALTRWGRGKSIHLVAALATATNPPPADPTWAGWTNLQPYQLTWAAELGALQAEQIVAEQIRCAGQWLAPVLVVTNLHAELYRGTLDATAQLDVATRAAGFDLRSDFDVHQLEPVLAADARGWLGKFSLAESPLVRGRGAVTLPAWTDRSPDWQTELLSTLRLAGDFAVTNGAYFGIRADWMRSQFSLTNLVWHLPDLEASRPDGAIRLDVLADGRTQDFYARLHSTADPRAVRPLLTPGQQRGFDLVTLSQPPLIDGELWGRGRDFDRLGFRGRVALTNFAVRGQTADFVVAELQYTNRELTVIAPQLARGPGPQVLTADGLVADFNSMRLYITNGFSTADPAAVVRAIGPMTAATMEPYQFLQPPTVRVNGFVPLNAPTNVDVRFVLDGGPFHWWKFNVPRVAGLVHWQGDMLMLTNMQMDFYGGSAAGIADFKFLPDGGTDYRFDMSPTNANLSLVMADLFPQTKNLEGHISGRLVVTRANADDLRSWEGYGHAELRDGLIWAIPIFGVFSKPLDAIVPGLGASRVSDGTATYVITNGVIFSDNLVMRAPTMRLKYKGTTDFEGRVAARVEAELLRDAWVVGRLVSLALWPVTKMMEYKVSGTLDNPKTEPIYIPKVLLIPLHPIRTIEELLTSETATTNAPPVYKETPVYKVP